MLMQGIAAGIAFVCCWVAWQLGTSPGSRRFWLPISASFGIAAWRWLLALRHPPELFDATLMLFQALSWFFGLRIYRKDHES
jgi:hypothetical protein